MRPSNPFESGGIASRWSAATRRKTAKGYGRYLCWLRECDELDETAGPAARVSRERLTAYLDNLRKMNRGHTIQCRIQELGDAMQALVPESDWRFINLAASRLRATTVAARDKRRRLPAITDVIAEGHLLMDEAEEEGVLSELGRAARFRDGLLIAFLAYHPLRLRNVLSLRMGHDLIVQDDRFVIQIDAPETKTRQRIYQELSPSLSCAMKRYIDRYRPVLCRPEDDGMRRLPTSYGFPATDHLAAQRLSEISSENTGRTAARFHRISSEASQRPRCRSKRQTRSTSFQPF
jgi:hypothetical protein